MQEYGYGFAKETGEVIEVYKPDPSEFEGLWCPEYCPRGRTDCKSLAQIIAQDHVSFICVGKNDGSTRELEEDQYRECFKNDIIDRMEDIDRKDLQHAAAVFSLALAVIEGKDTPEKGER